MRVAVCLHDHAEAQEACLDVTADGGGVAESVDGDATCRADEIDSALDGCVVEQFQRIRKTVRNVAEDLLHNHLTRIRTVDILIDRLRLRIEFGGKRNLEALQPAEPEFFAKARDRDLGAADRRRKLRDCLIHHLAHMRGHIVCDAFLRARHMRVVAPHHGQRQRLRRHRSTLLQC